MRIEDVLRSAFAVMVMATSTSALATDLTVLGFQLGKPLDLPECTFKMVAGMKLYEAMAARTCFEEPHKVNGYQIPARRVIFSDKESPSFVRDWQLVALELNGVLVGVEIPTWGAKGQSNLMQLLVSKYGNPTSKGTAKMSNSFGTAVDAITAEWKLKDVEVEFNGVTTSLDRGSVIIDLPEGAAMRRAWAESEMGQKRKM